MFLDQALACKFHFLKTVSKINDTEIYDKISQISSNFELDAKERIKAYKKNYRAFYEAGDLPPKLPHL